MMKKFAELFLRWYPENRGLFWGIVAGLIVAVLFLTIGFGSTLLIIVCVGIGALLGSRPDIRAAIAAFFKTLLTRRDGQGQ
jgi:uncharacterized membrane protein